MPRRSRPIARSRARQPHPAPAGPRLRRAPLPAVCGARPASGRTRRLTFTPTPRLGLGRGRDPVLRVLGALRAPVAPLPAALSEEKGRTGQPRLSPGWLFLRTTRLPFLTRHGRPGPPGDCRGGRGGTFDPLARPADRHRGGFAHLGDQRQQRHLRHALGADDANVNPTQFSGGSRVIHYGLVTLRQTHRSGRGPAGRRRRGRPGAGGDRSAALLWIGLAGIVAGARLYGPADQARLPGTR